MEAANIVSPFKYVLLFIVLVIAQVMVCNNILLFGVAIPFVFIYFIISLPLNLNQNLLMLISFLLGLLVDLFSDTLGLNSMACLILSVIKKPVFYLYIPKEDKFKDAVPSISTMGWLNYLKYILTLSAIFCLLIFGIEFMSVSSIIRILVMAASSTLFTLILLIASDALFNRT